jgi:16S rRNA (cytosine1402-N4)-methyltransferase
MSKQENHRLSHQPVLYQEIITAIGPKSDGFYVDGTVGAGGHAWGILNVSTPDGRLLGLDVDPQALELAEKRLIKFHHRVVLVQASYTTLETQLHNLGWQTVNGILLDLGASSMQFDMAERGFSFQLDGPLDMRFNPSNPNTAADFVNGLDVEELADLLYQYGEEKRSRHIARLIVANRPLQTTTQLADVVVKAIGRRRSGIHPATRTFQALRIAVNGELDALEIVLPQAIDVLCPGGRLAVISFHSLEDRRVKKYFRRESQDCICPPEQLVCKCEHRASIKLVTRKPMTPNRTEVKRNPRARSARLRVVEKLSVENGMA